MSKHSCEHMTFTPGCHGCAVKLAEGVFTWHDVRQTTHITQAPGGVVNTGVMGNQTTPGTQINLGSVSAGRNVVIGGTVVDHQHGGIRFHGPTAIKGPIIAGGARSVSIGGNLDGAVIITGDYGDDTTRVQYQTFRGQCEYCRVPYELRRHDGEPGVKCSGCGAPLPL